MLKELNLHSFKAFLFIFFICTISLVIITSCRKIDSLRGNKVELKDHSNTFFEVPTNASSPVKRIIAKAKQQNDSARFVNSLVKKAGLPQWEDAILYYGTAATMQRTNGPGQSTDTLVFIPFKKEGSSQVSSFLACAVGPDSVKMRLFRGDLYPSYDPANKLFQITDTVSGDFVSLYCMYLEYLQNNRRNTFRINDRNRLFKFQQRPDSGSTFVTMKESRQPERNIHNSGNNREIAYFTVTVCITYEVSNYEGQLVGFEPGQQPNWVHEETTCWTIGWWISNIDGGGGGTGDVTTIPIDGGGGGLAWYDDPPGCRTPNGGENPCTGDPRGGWEPIVDEPLPPYVINNLSKPCLKAVLNNLSGGVSNTFFKQVFNIFDNATNLHIIFNEANLDSINAYGVVDTSTIASIGFVVTVDIDTIKLISCSQEWIAYVFIHEIAHAGMFANAIQWDTTSSHHEVMISQYLTEMANSLTIAYPGLSTFDAYAMCYAGFYYSIDGISANPAFLYIMLREVKNKLNDPSIQAQQLIDRGIEYTENGSKGIRSNCN